MNYLLPPSDDIVRNTQVSFLCHVREEILECAVDADDINKMSKLVFNILTSIDGFYINFPHIKMIDSESGKLISGDLHKVFSFIMNNENIICY